MREKEKEDEGGQSDVIMPFITFRCDDALYFYTEITNVDVMQQGPKNEYITAEVIIQEYTWGKKQKKKIFQSIGRLFCQKS